jgi:hypothetical protein
MAFVDREPLFKLAVELPKVTIRKRHKSLSSRDVSKPIFSESYLEKTLYRRPELNIKLRSFLCNTPEPVF